MLDLLGKGYVIDHCISLFKNKQKDEIYRMYVTDALYSICNMTGKRYGATSDIIKKKYSDIVSFDSKKKQKKEETEEEIIQRIKMKLGAKQ